MSEALPLQSPRLEALRTALQAGDLNAIPAFWQEMSERHTPLIEAIDDAPDRRLVSFLWRQDDADPRENVIAMNLLGSADFNAMRMTLLPDSNVWFLTHVVRSDVRTTYQLGTNDTLVGFAEESDWATRMQRWFTDPLNPRSFRSTPPSDDPKAWHRVGSVLQLPDAEPMEWFDRRSGITAGDVTQHRIVSDVLGHEHDIWLYLPPGHDARGEPPGLLVLFDGAESLHVLDAPGTLDALIAAGAIPPLAAVMVGAVDRSVELPPSEDWIAFLRDELLPWVRDRVSVSDDPARSVVSGASYGGLCAAWCGLRLPDLFGNVLSQSGSFWWKPDPFEHAQTAIAGEAFDYEWLILRYVESPTLPVRFYMDVGSLENKWARNGPTQLQSNRHMRDVLRSKGYEVHYREYAGGHDYLWWRATLADGLITLIGR